MSTSCNSLKKKVIEDLCGGNKNVFVFQGKHFLLGKIGECDVNDDVFNMVYNVIINATAKDLFEASFYIKMIRSVHLMFKGAYERGLFKAISKKIEIRGSSFFRKLVSMYLSSFSLSVEEGAMIVLSDTLVKIDSAETDRLYLCCVGKNDVCDDYRYFLNFDKEFSVGLTCDWRRWIAQCIAYFVVVPVLFDEVMNYVKCDDIEYPCIDVSCECNKQAVEHDLEYVVVNAAMGVQYEKMVESYECDHGGDDMCESCERICAVESVSNLYCICKWCYGTCCNQKGHPILDRSLHKHMRCMGLNVDVYTDRSLYEFIQKIFACADEFSRSDHCVGILKEMKLRADIVMRGQKITWGDFCDGFFVVGRKKKKGRDVKGRSLEEKKKKKK